MEDDIKELKAFFMKKFYPEYSPDQCHMFAKAAISEGYARRKCFDKSHKEGHGRKTL